MPIFDWSVPSEGAVARAVGETIVSHDLDVFDQRGTTFVVGAILTTLGSIFLLVADPDDTGLKFEWARVDGGPALNVGETLVAISITVYDARRKDMVLITSVRTSEGRVFYRYWTNGGVASSPWVELPLPPVV